MALTLLELVSKAVEKEEADPTTESVWRRRIEPAVPEEETTTTKSDDEIEAGVVRMNGEWEVSTPNPQEDKLVSKLMNMKKRGTFLKAEFIAIVKPALESENFNVPDENGAVDGHIPKSGRSYDETVFLRLLKKRREQISQRLLAAIITCSLGLQYWEALRLFMEFGLVSSSSHRDLIPKLVEHKKADFLCLSFQHVLDLSASDLLLALKFLLDNSNSSLHAFEAHRQEWRKAASASIAYNVRERDFMMKRDKAQLQNAILPAESEHVEDRMEIGRAVALAMAVDGFQGWETGMHTLLASGQDEAILAAIIEELDTSEAVKLLQYLRKWLDRYENRLSRYPSPPVEPGKRGKLAYNVPSLQIVIHWVNMVLDGQYTKCVLSPEILPELVAIQNSVKAVVAIGSRIIPLVGTVEHIRRNIPLPAPAHQNASRRSAYTIEYLDIS